MPMNFRWRWRVLAWILPAMLAGGCQLPRNGAPRPMLVPEPASGFAIEVLFTTGDGVGAYGPPGVLDGLVALPGPDPTVVSVFANHELKAGDGRPYALANGTVLTGSRLTRFEVDRMTRRITAAGLAYREIRDRAGRAVTDPAQLSEAPGRGNAGLEALCSAAGWSPGDYGFVDALLLTHEEVSRAEGHPHGGTVFALDVAGGVLWALPELGRGSWENSAAVRTPDQAEPDGHVALLLGDDLEFGRAPLYLWIGRKIPGGNFIERNGLARGDLHVWVATGGDRTPDQWTGSGTSRQGRFVPLATRRVPGEPGTGTDAAGYFDDVELRARAERLGAFTFSRPEDLHTDPRTGNRVAFASTGHGGHFPADDWGNLYLIDMAFIDDGVGGLEATATIQLRYDSDERGDLGLRSPDNVVWAGDGRVYVQEDRATKLGAFGAASGREASIWALDPGSAADPSRIAAIDRGALPPGTTDRKAGEIGAWESSGIIDVTPLLGRPGELLLLATVQAHGVTDGPTGGPRQLVEASQLLLLRKGTGHQ